MKANILQSNHPHFNQVYDYCLFLSLTIDYRSCSFFSQIPLVLSKEITYMQSVTMRAYEWTNEQAQKTGILVGDTDGENDISTYLLLCILILFVSFVHSTWWLLQVINLEVVIGFCFLGKQTKLPIKW